MDILDILLDILLKPPQPFIGLFFLHILMYLDNNHNYSEFHSCGFKFNEMG